MRLEKGCLSFNWDDKDIMEKLRKQTFRENKLTTMLFIKKGNSPYMAITKAFPEKGFEPWELANAPNNYWKGSIGKKNASKLIKWIIEEGLKEGVKYWTIKEEYLY